MKTKGTAGSMRAALFTIAALLLLSNVTHAIHQGATASGGWLPHAQGMGHPLDQPVNAACPGEAFLMNLGPTGIRAWIKPQAPKNFEVKFVFQDDYSPAKGKIGVGDHIVGANGKMFQNPHGFHRKHAGSRGWQGPPFELALAIEDSQGKDGKLDLMVLKGGTGSPVNVTLQLEPVGRFSDSWPWNCKRSDKLLKDLLDFIFNDGMPGGRPAGIQSKLAVWASGDPRAIPIVKQQAAGLMRGRPSPDGGGFCCWGWGFNGIFLGEYYNAFKDPGCIPAAEALNVCYDQGMTWEAGSYSHRPYPVIQRRIAGGGPKGYGAMAPPGGLAMLAMSLFKQTGLPYREHVYNRIHQSYLGSVGHGGSGSIAYGFGGGGWRVDMIRLKDPNSPCQNTKGFGYLCPTGMKNIGPFVVEKWARGPAREGGRPGKWDKTLVPPTGEYAHLTGTGNEDFIVFKSGYYLENPGIQQRRVVQPRFWPEPTGPIQNNHRGGGHNAPVGLGALAHFIGNAGNKPWNWLGKHLATCCAYSPKTTWDGHASAELCAFWNILGAFRADEKDLRHYLDYYKTLIVLSETHEERSKGGMVEQPFGCQRNATCSIARNRKIYTYNTILLLSIPKRKLLITGAGASIPGASKLSLTGDALAAYDLIEKGDMAKALLKITPLKKNATGTMLNQLESMEKFALKPVLRDLENLETLHGQQNMFKLNEELNAKDKKYRGIPAYDEKVTTYRQTLAQPANQRLVKVGGAFYKLVDHWESPSGRSEKKGKKLETLKRYVGNYKDTPYGPIALNYAREPFTEFANVVNDLSSLKRKNDVFGARRAMAKANPEYRMYSTFVEKTAPMNAWLNSPESRELLNVGVEYYRIVDMTKRNPAPRKGQTLQALKDFVGKHGKTSYGPVALSFARDMIVEMNGKLMEVDRTIRSDPYKAYAMLSSLNREYGMYSTYLQKREPVKAKLEKPDTRKLVQIGSSYYKLTKTIARSAGMNKGGNLDKMQSFINSYGDTPYGRLARESHAEMITELEEAVGAIQKLLDLGDPFQASLEIAKTNRQYGSSKVYQGKLAPITNALQTPENRKMKAVGATYYRLVGEAEKRPGNSTRQRVEKFAQTYKGTAYGQMAADLASSM